MDEIGVAIRQRWGESDRVVPRAVVQPIQRLLSAEAAGGAVMVLAAVAALVWANSPWHESYRSLWRTAVELKAGPLGVSFSLQEFVNDVMMTPFFFLAALEIKREFIYGDLRDRKAAALPVLAALGGMVVPALVFTLFNRSGDGARGWGIPMATDIAFAVGIVTLLGKRVPLAARTFLLTLAVADDIGGIAVIAFFYSSSLKVGWLLAFAGCLAAAAIAARLHIRHYAIYLPLGVAAWYTLEHGGVHATIAGVMFGVLTPAWAFSDPSWFADAAQPLIDRISATFKDDILTAEESEGNEGTLRELVRLANETMSPLERHLASLGPWIAFVVVPIFALANAGVRFVGGSVGNPFADRVVLGVMAGLVIGKAVGVTAASALAVRLGIGRLPGGTTWRMLFGLAVTAGVGFTVALFVADLAFENEATLDAAKVGILLGSFLASILGYLTLRWATASHSSSPSSG